MIRAAAFLGGWALILAMGVAISNARVAEAHVTKCPPEPVVTVELVQWWDVDTRTEGGGCNVSVNAPDYDSAAAAGLAVCGGTVTSLRASSARANEPTRWTE